MGFWKLDIVRGDPVACAIELGWCICEANSWPVTGTRIFEGESGLLEADGDMGISPKPQNPSFGDTGFDDGSVGLKA